MEHNFTPDSENGAQPDLFTIDSSTSAARKPRGKPFEPGNRHGQGRPLGSRNKRLLLQEFLEEYGQPVVHRIVKKAADGDRTAMKLVMDRLLPVAQEDRMAIELPELRTSSDLTAASAAVIEALAKGEITVEQSRAMAELLQAHRSLFVSEEMERRVASLEQSRSTSGNVPALQTIVDTEDPKTETGNAVNPPEASDAR